MRLLTNSFTPSLKIFGLAGFSAEYKKFTNTDIHTATVKARPTMLSWVIIINTHIRIGSC